MLLGYWERSESNQNERLKHKLLPNFNIFFKISIYYSPCVKPKMDLYLVEDGYVFFLYKRRIKYVNLAKHTFSHFSILKTLWNIFRFGILDNTKTTTLFMNMMNFQKDLTKTNANCFFLIDFMETFSASNLYKFHYMHIMHTEWKFLCINDRRLTRSKFLI